MPYNCKKPTSLAENLPNGIFIFPVDGCTLHKVKLPRFLRRLLGQTSNRKVSRQATLARIKEMGFQVQDISGWHEGKFAPRRYLLIDPSGKVLDNGGDGFASSAEAYRAAIAATDHGKE